MFRRCSFCLFRAPMAVALSGRACIGVMSGPEVWGAAVRMEDREVLCRW